MAAKVSEKDVLSVLGKVRDPDLQDGIVSLGCVRNVQIRDSVVNFELVFPVPLFPAKEKIRHEAAEATRALAGVSSVNIAMKCEISGTPPPSLPPQGGGMEGKVHPQGGGIEGKVHPQGGGIEGKVHPQGGEIHGSASRQGGGEGGMMRGQGLSEESALSQVRNIVAVGSGKGGVGKSTVCVNLAVGLAKYGARVGLLDGDIYGPTVPIMMGAKNQELFHEEGRIIPAMAHGVKFMSMGFMARGDQPLIWRGPMAHKAIQESLHHVDWGELDYLLVDMPPGTGDVHLTLVQTVSVTGAVIVSTPQDVGLTISMKTYRMFEQTQVHVLGLIENMSYHICSHCGQREEIFGHGIVSEAGKKLNIPFLGEIPLDRSIREHADQGAPVVIADPDAPSSRAYLRIAEGLASRIFVRNSTYRPVLIEEEPEEQRQTFSV